MDEKYTLSEVISRINMVLNYPAVTYEDLYVFFDMAIAELNTTLHTDIKSFTNMIKEYSKSTLEDTHNRVVLTDEPDSSTVITVFDTISQFTSSSAKYGYVNELNSYVIVKPGNTRLEYTVHAELFGVYNNMSSVTFYKALKYTMDGAFWVECNFDNPLELDVLQYLTEDWISLYIIPYVCFKYACREGGTASVFAEEFTQGFQQLQDAYDVTENVLLATVADLLAYRQDVKNNIPNLNVKVSTKAITKSMKHKRQINATYGNMFDRGGWYD